MLQWKWFCSLHAKLGLSDLEMFDITLCSIIIIAEGLVTSSGSIMLVILRLDTVFSAAVTTRQLVSPSFTSYIIYRHWNWLEKTEVASLWHGAVEWTEAVVIHHL